MRRVLGLSALPAIAAGPAHPPPPPTTQPAVVTAPAAKAPALPPSFSVLLKRSIFARNGLAAEADGPAAPPGGPEAALALRGIARDDTGFLAFIEDLASHRTLRLKIGDAVAAGKIGGISLDDLRYVVGARVTRVRVGQNFSGMALPPIAPPKPAGPPAGPPAQAAGGPPPNGAPGGPVFEIAPNGQRVVHVNPRPPAG